MTTTIVREVVRPPDHLVDSFRDASSADVHEAMGKSGAMAPAISPAIEGSKLCGPAVTVELPAGDNMMIHLAAKLAEPGDVLVIATNTTRGATWGELATRNAMRVGIEGIVSDGNVRDVDRVSELGFPVFSRAISQIGATKNTPGSVNVPVTVGDVIVRPGDIVVGDGDGVTVVPQRSAREISERLETKEEAEDEIRRKIDDGESLFDVIVGEDHLEGYDINEVPGPIDYSEF